MLVLVMLQLWQAAVSDAQGYRGEPDRSQLPALQSPARRLWWLTKAMQARTTG